jgi:hypothetical protein
LVQIIAFEKVWRYGHNKLRADDKHNVIFGAFFRFFWYGYVLTSA